MDWHNVDQNSDQWLQMRVGKIGGSSIGKIMANFGKSFGDPAKKLAVKKALEQITGKSQEDSYTNEHMQRGHEQEPIARALYEETYFCDVTNGGFYEDGDIGVSPDGIVGNGLIEIKSVISTTHFETVRKNTYDSAYKWQLFFNLKVSGLDWIDYVSFCATFPRDKRLFKSRIKKEECSEKFDMIDQRLVMFRSLVEENKMIINNL